MKSILKQLYNGELCPCEDIEPKLEEYKEEIQKMCNKRSDFYEALDKGLKLEFEEITSDFYSLFPLEMTQSFVQGFSLGVRIMAEAYNVKD